MKHVATAEFQMSEYLRINRLLAIQSLSEMSDAQLLEAGANTDYFEGVMYVDFDDGSHLTYDLCSGQENYYDNVVWTNKDGTNEVVLDCSFELSDIEFEIDGEEYVVHIITTQN